jgi:signal transduction histidine kinase
MKRFQDTILNVPVTDPDDARRRRVLNIFLAGTLTATIIGLANIALSGLISNELNEPDTRLLLAGTLATAIGTFSIYWINRKYSGRLAALLYLLLLTFIFIFSDTPAQLSNGRSLFLFTIPIAISSLILLPEASFLFALLSSGIITLLAFSSGQPINFFAIIGFFMLALASWLSARSLESTLLELRTINANLDQIITQRTQALAASLTRERIEAGRNQAILNSIADGVIVFDRNWNAILVNPAIRSLLEIPPEVIVNHNFRDIIEHPKLSARSRGLLYAMMEHDTQPLSFRIEWGNKTLSVSAAQVYDVREEGSHNIGTVTVFRDFTREAELEKLKSAFVAIVSHELRTPLNAILGYAEMFREAIYGPMNDKQINMAERIITNTRRLLGLINDLLDQAQIEAGKLTIHNGPLRPSELLEHVHHLLDKPASEKNLRLTSEMDDTLPETLIGDSARIEQILVNLVTNAIKFTDAGEIRIRLFHLPHFHKWGIEVTDTGRGIPPSELPYIFETFRQVENDATRSQGGFGLGLAIVKQLVNLMNGEIKVASEPGQGSTFTVTLPLVTP